MFYGSQTGTAEEFAGRLAKEGIRYKLKGMVADPEECEMVRTCNVYNCKTMHWTSCNSRKIYTIKHKLF